MPSGLADIRSSADSAAVGGPTSEIQTRGDLSAMQKHNVGEPGLPRDGREQCGRRFWYQPQCIPMGRRRSGAACAIGSRELPAGLFQRIGQRGRQAHERPALSGIHNRAISIARRWNRAIFETIFRDSDSQCIQFAPSSGPERHMSPSSRQVQKPAGGQAASKAGVSPTLDPRASRWRPCAVAVDTFHS